MGRRWALSSVAAWCAFLAPGAILPVKFQFEVGTDQAGMKIVDFAAGPDRLYFLFTGSGKSEVKAFDFTGRPVESAMQKVPAASPVPIATGRLPVWEDDPVLLVPAGNDSFVIIQAFSGILRRVGLDGVVRTQRTMSGPGLDEVRATLGDGEGLFGPTTASDSGGVYVVLGRSSPATGVAVQKYDFDGNFVKELRLPFLYVSRLIVRKDTIYVVDFVKQRVAAFECGGICSNSIP